MSTTATSNQPLDNSSLANFKAWAQAISNAFSAFGWTQTADTGQVVWGSIGAVPSSTYVYEIWKQNDASSATMQVFVKVEYGFSTSNVGIRMTVGTGSNGTGTITGNISLNAKQLLANGSTVANNGATLIPCFFSGHAGEFRMYMWQGNSAGAVVFGIERSKDTSGADTDEYVTAFYANTIGVGASTMGQQTILKTGLVTALETTIISPGVSTAAGTGSFNGTVAAFPVFPFIGKLGNPMIGLMAVVDSDVADGATVTVASMYGSTHTFISAKAGNTSSGIRRIGMGGNNSCSNMAALMRYE